MWTEWIEPDIESILSNKNSSCSFVLKSILFFEIYYHTSTLTKYIIYNVMNDWTLFTRSKHVSDNLKNLSDRTQHVKSKVVIMADKDLMEIKSQPFIDCFKWENESQ